MNAKDIITATGIILGWGSLFFTIDSRIDSTKQGLQNELAVLKMKVESLEKQYNESMEALRGECLSKYSKNLLGLLEFERTTNARIVEIEGTIWQDEGDTGEISKEDEQTSE